MTSPGLDHVSFSQLTMFRRCEKQWFYRYIEGLKQPTGAMLLLGSSYHAAHEHNFRQKIESGKDVSTTEVCEAFAVDFDRRRQDEEIDWQGEKPGPLKDQGVGLVTRYHTDVSPNVQPLGVEVEDRLTFANASYAFVVRIDLITPNLIIDHKTAKRAYSEADVAKDLQISAYLTAARYGPQVKTFWPAKKPPRFRFDIAVKNKTPRIQQILAARTDADIAWFLAWVPKVAARIQHACDTGVFIENTDGWHCSPNFCGYFNLCKPYNYSGVRSVSVSETVGVK